MASRNITTTYDHDYVDIRVTVNDASESADKAVDIGITAALVLGSAQIARAIAGIDPLSESNEVVETVCERQIGEIWCSVRVRGRFKGANPFSVSELFGAIANEAITVVALKATCDHRQDPERRGFRDFLGEMFGEAQSSGFPGDLFSGAAFSMAGGLGSNS